MSGYGGIVAMGLAGAASGVGESGSEDILMKQKEDMLTRREAMLSQLRVGEHAATSAIDQAQKIGSIAPTAAANADATQKYGDIAAAQAGKVAGAEAKAKVPSVIAERQALVPHGDSIPKRDVNQNIIGWDSPPAPAESESLANYHNAHAEQARAWARLYDAKATNQPTGKEIYPIIKNTESDDGKKGFIEQRFGLLGRVVPGTPDTPESDPSFLSRLAGAQYQPAKPGTPERVQWSDENGHVVKLADVYTSVKAAQDAAALGAASRAKEAPSDAPAGRSSGGAIKYPDMQNSITKTTRVQPSTPPGLPAGSTYAGLSNDKDRRPVWEAPDGTRYKL